MDESERTALKIEKRFALADALYWAAACAIEGFPAVYLAHRGMSDSLIGVTVALTSIFAIVMQLILSNYCDHHPEVPLRRMVTILLLVSYASVAALSVKTLPVAAVGIFMILSDMPQKADSGLLNAMMVQYTNEGLPVRYGWPRGVGSIGWAAGAYIFGKVMDKSSPDILPRIFLIIEIFAIASIQLMPKSSAPRKARSAGAATSSYGEMLSKNRALRLFLLAAVATSVGQAALGTFLNRIVESLGGGTKELGIAIMIQSGMELPVMLLSGFILRKFKPGVLVAASFAFYSLKSVALAFCPSLGVLYAIMISGFFCYGLYCFSNVLYANNIVADDQKVRAQSLATLCYTGGLGGVIGNTLGGIMMDKYGLNVIYVFSAVLSAAGFVLMLMSLRSVKLEKNAEM